MKNIDFLWAVLVAWMLFSAAAYSSAEGVTVETVLTGLNAPAGVAVRPRATGPHEIYVAESGAGRIVRLKSDQPNTSIEVIRGLPTKAADEIATASIGLLFLDRERLVVIGRATSDDAKAGTAIARLYEVPADDKTLSADQMKQHLDLPGEAQLPAAHNISPYALARTRPNDHVPDMLLVITPSTNPSRELSRIPVRAGTFGELGNYSLAKERTPTGAPTAIAVNEQGFVVLSFAGGTSPLESQLAFVNPIDSSVVMQIKIDLPNVSGLAYSTNSSSLYVVNSPQSAGEKGGVYRIDSVSRPGKPAARAVKLADIENPTAIASGPDGTLYVTDCGRSVDTSTTEGRLLKLSGEL